MREGEYSKPPLGVMPRHIWVAKRVEELSRAITEYALEFRSINPEWVKEYNDLIKEVSDQ